VLTNSTRASTITALDTRTGTTSDTVVITGNKDLTITAWNATTGGNEVLTASTFTGNLTVTSASGAATIIGGSGSDVLTGGSQLADSLVGGAGDDILSGGAGSAADTLVGGTGSDRFIMTGNMVTADRITDFSVSGTNGTDVLVLSVGGATGIPTGVNGTASAAFASLANGNSATIGAGTTVGVTLVSEATTLTAATNVVVLSGTFATQALMETAIEVGGTRQLTFGTALQGGEDILLLWSDGTNAYFGAFDARGTATTASAASTFGNFVTLAGVTSVDNFTAANFLISG